LSLLFFLVVHRLVWRVHCRSNRHDAWRCHASRTFQSREREKRRALMSSRSSWRSCPLSLLFGAAKALTVCPGDRITIVAFPRRRSWLSCRDRFSATADRRGQHVRAEPTTAESLKYPGYGLALLVQLASRRGHCFVRRLFCAFSATDCGCRRHQRYPTRLRSSKVACGAHGVWRLSAAPVLRARSQYLRTHKRGVRLRCLVLDGAGT